MREELKTELERFKARYPVDPAAQGRISRPPVEFIGEEILNLAVSALLQGENVLLCGEKATGKNILADNLAWLLGRPSYNISFHVNTDSSTLIGTDTFTGGEVRLRRGPVAQAAQLLRRKQSAALLHTDAVQGFLKIPFTPKGLGVDLLTISGHKIGAMKGSGALYLRKGLRAVPLIRGGGQERGLRSGTEATPQIAALAAAASLGRERMEEHTAALTDLKAYALETFQRGVPGLAVVSPGDAPHICAISLPGYPSQVVVRWLSDRGFCVSSGSACHRGKASHVYAAMHLSKGVRDGVLRISFGPENTRQEVDQLAQALLEATRDLVPARG